MARMSAETETSIRDRILDAAGACLVDFGIQRTTINEIAERSSLSRTTVYNHFPSRDAIVAAYLWRELEQLFAHVTEVLDKQTSGEDVIVEAVVAVVRFAAENAPYQRVLALEPSLVLPWVTTRSDALLRAIAGVLDPYVRAAIEKGEFRDVDVKAACTWVARSALSLVLAPEAKDWSEDELGEFVREYVVIGLRDR